jgi:hypothetical protein
VIGVSLAVAPFVLAVAGVVVQGEGQDGCPSAAAVSARLDQLLGDEAGEAPDALVVDGRPGALRVRLLSPEGRLREQKTLELRGSCDELADAVATVAVAWRSHLQSDDVPPPVLPARVEQRYSPPAPSSVAGQPDFELTYGLQTVVGAERWAPGLVLGTQSPIAGRFSLGFGLQIPAPRRGKDGPAGAEKSWRWMELAVIIAPSFRGSTTNFLVDLQLGLGAGVNVTTSESLTAPDSYRLAPPALVGGLRWTYRHTGAHPWIGASFATRLGGGLDSPIHNAQLTPEAWWLGLAAGGTVTFEVR